MLHILIRVQRFNHAHHEFWHLHCLSLSTEITQIFTNYAARSQQARCQDNKFCAKAHDLYNITQLNFISQPCERIFTHVAFLQPTKGAWRSNDKQMVLKLKFPEFLVLYLPEFGWLLNVECGAFRDGPKPNHERIQQ